MTVIFKRKQLKVVNTDKNTNYNIIHNFNHIVVFPSSLDIKVQNPLLINV